MRNSTENWKNKVGFVLGTGRNGTHFFRDIMKKSRVAASSHERHPMNDTFHRYCKWYGLSVDAEGFLAQKTIGIRADLEHHAFSFEASTYLSLSVEELYARFQAKFILVVRTPQAVIESLWHKGWYNKPYIRLHADLPPTYQDVAKPHHFFGRIMPSGEKFHAWQKMSRVGQLAWYWSALNGAVLEQFTRIPETHYRVVRLEDLDYSAFLDTQAFFGLKPKLGKVAFDALVSSKPKSFVEKRTQVDWNATEVREFEQETKDLAAFFGYR